ncbi:CBO0543 family protein [Piscibacillus salipiscarius]|uniref:CBO0543 family protein n=1 Tax=Piscibacillus salipiscarius TaxID=299480 RepID=A0ABW5Q9E3_9BACI
MNQYPKLSDQMNQQLLEAREYKLQLWTEYVLFDWHWWLGVILTIGPILVWIMFHKRNERKSLLLAGLTTAILAAAIDTSGQFFGWYDYRYDVFPMAPNYVPWDFVLIPISVMFTIQLFRNINAYLKGAIYSVIVAFTVLPILSSIDIYVLNNWNYFYSFIALFSIYVIAYLASQIKNTK